MMAKLSSSMPRPSAVICRMSFMMFPSRRGDRRAAQNTTIEVQQNRLHRERRDQRGVAFEMSDDARANRVGQTSESRTSREFEYVARRVGGADLLDELRSAIQVFRNRREQLRFTSEPAAWVI